MMGNTKKLVEDFYLTLRSILEENYEQHFIGTDMNIEAIRADMRIKGLIS